ncbi:hypothetical protein LQW54_012929 [Pestalotiopsis sp. IQ-011]
MVNSNGETALHLAAKLGYFSVVMALASRDPEGLWIETAESDVALDLIVQQGILKNVEEFVQMLENVSGKDFPRRGKPLHSAVELGQTEILEFLLHQGWDRNAIDSRGNSALHLARDPEIVGKLLAANAKNDEKNQDGETPLFLAVWNGDVDVIRLLLQSIPKPDTRTTDRGGWNLLHAAYDDGDIVKLLLGCDVDRDAQNEDGRTPLSLALATGNIDTANVLIEAGADPNVFEAFESSPLYIVFDNPNFSGSPAEIEVAKSLISKGANLLNEGRDGMTVLRLAIRSNVQEAVDFVIENLNRQHPDERIFNQYTAALCECVSMPNFNPGMANILIEQGLDVNKVTALGFNALQVACADGTVDAVEWLLSEKVDINAKGSKYGTALCAAIESTPESREGKVLLLLEHEPKAEVNFNDGEHRTPLQQAIAKGDGSMVELLLRYEADVNCMNGNYDTLLNDAIWQPGLSLDVVKLLIRDEADIQKRGLKGRLPVHIAAISGRDDVMGFLLSKQTDVCIKDDDGISPLLYGLTYNHSSVVKLLLSEGTYDLGEADPKGQTPLILAIMLEDKSCVDELLKKAPKQSHILDAQDFHGKTALAYAVLKSDHELVTALLEKGADPRVTDCRGYSPLYWAVRTASTETFEAIITSMRKFEMEVTEHLNIAIHGASASSSRQAFEKLLEWDDVDVTFPTPDGWTPLYTLQRYESNRMERILIEKLGLQYEDKQPSLEIPSRWHPEDKHPGIRIDPDDHTTIMTDDTERYLNLKALSNGDGNQEYHYGVVRTDFPMLPLLKGRVYYFEVTVQDINDVSCKSVYLNGTFNNDLSQIAIGFCDDEMPLNIMLGWEMGSWGFHSDSGCLFDDGSWRGIRYHEPWEGVATIGCGVNFGTNMAFYTMNGALIGEYRIFNFYDTN